MATNDGFDEFEDGVESDPAYTNALQARAKAANDKHQRQTCAVCGIVNIKKEMHAVRVVGRGDGAYKYACRNECMFLLLTAIESSLGQAADSN